MQYYVGIDISKDSFQHLILNNPTQTIASGNLPMSLEGFKSLLNTLKSLPEPVVVMESSGRFHIPLYLFLTENNIQTFILNPKIVHKFFEFISTNNPSKQDKKDAKILALFALNNPKFLKSYLKTLNFVFFPVSSKNLNMNSLKQKPKSNTPFPFSSQKLKNTLISTPGPSLTSSLDILLQKLSKKLNTLKSPKSLNPLYRKVSPLLSPLKNLSPLLNTPSVSITPIFLKPLYSTSKNSSSLNQELKSLKTCL